MTARDENDQTSPVIFSGVRPPLEDAPFLQAVLRDIPAFIARFDPERRIDYINHLWAGMTSDQVIGHSVGELLPGEQFARYQQAVAQALQTGQLCRFHFQGRRPVRSRGSATYEGYAVPFENADGRRAVCSIAFDVSEHVARAEALRESEEQLRLAVEATGIGLWTWDVIRDRMEWNARMSEILGHPPMSARQYVERLVHPEDRERMRIDTNAALAGRPSYQEHRIIRPDGDVRWILPSGREIRDESGKLVRMVGGALDITEQRKTAEHLRQAQRLEAIGNLSAGVTHNFNNMLGMIIPNIQFALRGATPDQTEMLRDALHAARRATELVAGLMTFAGQRRSAAAQPHDLTQLVQSAVSMCMRSFGDGIRLETRLAPGCGDVCCDPTAIEQVVVNLLINARDAVLAAERSDPQISVELFETLASAPGGASGAPRRYARIRVRDNGTGMSDAVMQRMFEPFYTTKPAGKGTGLGLATSYGIVRDHDGFISFESQLGTGTVAEVSLPITASAQAAVPAATGSQGARSAARSTILVVDDEDGMRRMMRAALAERGHEVLLASSGEEAARVLAAGARPALIVLDRSMPGWSSRLTLSKLREQLPDVPIVFFTGHEVPSDERALVRAVLYKPLSTEELLRAVEAWLPEKR